MKTIQDILKENKSTYFSYIKEDKIIISFTEYESPALIRELVNITSDLEDNNIKYFIDSMTRIKIIK